MFLTTACILHTPLFSNVELIIPIIEIREKIPTGTIVLSDITYEISVADVTLSIDKKKRRIEYIYSGGGWKEEDEYKVKEIS